MTAGPVYERPPSTNQGCCGWTAPFVRRPAESDGFAWPHRDGRSGASSDRRSHRQTQEAGAPRLRVRVVSGRRTWAGRFTMRSSRPVARPQITRLRAEISARVLDCSLDCFVSQRTVPSGSQRSVAHRPSPINALETSNFPANATMPEEGLEPPTRGL
jgi:hypothetical protein